MATRIFQGKDIIAQGSTLVPHRGEIFVDLDTLTFAISDGVTPGGVAIHNGGGGGGGFPSFQQITGQLSESQIASGTIINTMLRTDSAATATWLLSANPYGGFTWVKPFDAGQLPNLSNVAITGDYNDLTHRPVLAQVSTSGSYYSLLDYPTALSSFVNNMGYLTSATLSSYVTTGTLNNAVSAALGNLVGSSGTTFQVISDLAAALTNTNTLQTLTDNIGHKLDISTVTTYTTQQKAIGVSNLGLAAVAVSGSYNDLSDLPSTFSVPIASSSQLGGIRVGFGLTVNPADGTVSLTTVTTILGIGAPQTLQGQLNQVPGQVLVDDNYLYVATSNFAPSGFSASQTANTFTNVITTMASQWYSQVNTYQSSYVPGAWTIYDSTKQQAYPVTSIATVPNQATAFFTIQGTVTYTINDTFYISTNDTWVRLPEMNHAGAINASVQGNAVVNQSNTITMPLGEAYGTTYNLAILDCTNITYGELAFSWQDLSETEYYKGTVEVYVYPDNTYTIHPNVAGNKTDKLVVGLTNGVGTFTNANSIAIPIYNGDRNSQNNNITKSASVVQSIKYSWLVRSNV